MLFYTWQFIGLFCVTLLVYWTVPSTRVRKWWLLFISYVFYGYWDVRFLGLLVASSAVDYKMGRLIVREEDKRKRRKFLFVSLVLNLGTLFVFKYFNFFSDSLQAVGRSLGYEYEGLTLDVIIPLGISFYTFHALSYIFDLYNRKIKPCESRLDFMLYVAFFPQLLAGPIVRARDFVQQMPHKKLWSEVPVRACLLLFLLGMIKKVCVGDNIGQLLDPVFETPELYNATTLYLAALLFVAQVYADFSGYTDMAIATARLLGFVIPVNFFWPCLAENVAEFWRRWHISLGSWFRDYVFMPLGGYKRNPLLALRNLMITMGLIGLWHGADTHYVVWGLWNGVAIWGYSVYRNFMWKLTRGKPNLFAVKLPRMVQLVLNVALTNFVISLSAFFFRMPDLNSGYEALLQTLYLRDSGIETIVWQQSIMLSLLIVVHSVMYRYKPTLVAERMPSLAYGALMGVLLAFLVLAMAVDVPPFIYFDY